MALVSSAQPKTQELFDKVETTVESGRLLSEFELELLLREAQQLPTLEAQWTISGVSYAASGKIESARNYMQRILSLQDFEAASIVNIIAVIGQQGYQEHARIFANEVLELWQSKDALLSAAYAELACGSSERAKSLLQQIAEQATQHSSDLEQGIRKLEEDIQNLEQFLTEHHISLEHYGYVKQAAVGLCHEQGIRLMATTHTAFDMEDLGINFHVKAQPEQCVELNNSIGRVVIEQGLPLNLVACFEPCQVMDTQAA